MLLFPLNVTMPPSMYTAPPSRCTRRRSSDCGRRRTARLARGRKVTHRCARVGDRHAVEDELALKMQYSRVPLLLLSSATTIAVPGGWRPPLRSPAQQRVVAGQAATRASNATAQSTQQDGVRGYSGTQRIASRVHAVSARIAIFRPERERTHYSNRTAVECLGC